MSVYEIKTDTLHSTEKVEAITDNEEEAKQEVEYKKFNKPKSKGQVSADDKDDEPMEHIDIIV